MGLLSILSLLPCVILLDGNRSPDDALRNGAATNDLVPFYMWVAPETKRRFMEMCSLACKLAGDVPPRVSRGEEVCFEFEDKRVT